MAVLELNFLGKAYDSSFSLIVQTINRSEAEATYEKKNES